MIAHSRRLVVAIRCIVIGVQWKYHDTAETICFYKFRFARDASLIFEGDPFGAGVHVRRTTVFIEFLVHKEIIALEPAHIRIGDESGLSNATVTRCRATNSRIQRVHQTKKRNVVNWFMSNRNALTIAHRNECPYVGNPIIILLLSKPWSCQ